MKAAILREFKQPLTIEEVETPSPGPDEVLIKIDVCGVCHSDLHLAEGDWPQLVGVIKRPLILGHEVVGHIVEKGEDVRELRIGDRVGVAWLYSSCGQCDICKEGNENLCPSQKTTGATIDGGYAQYIKAKGSHAIKVPAALTSEEAAPLFCAGVTVYRALKKARLTPGLRVAVFGVGGLGHLAVQVARALGAEVSAVDVSNEKLELARALGAARLYNAGDSDLVKQIRADGRVHAAVVTSAAKAAYDAAFYSIRPGGSLLVIGLPAEPLSFPAIMMVATEITIMASAVGTRVDLKEILDMAARRSVRCMIETRPLDQINETLADMKAGRINGRVVIKAWL